MSVRPVSAGAAVLAAVLAGAAAAPFVAAAPSRKAAPVDPDVVVPPGFWERLGPPERGSWRDIVREQPQTLRAYRDAGPIRPTATRTRVYVYPLLTRPPRDPDALKRIATALEAFFGRPVTVRKPGALPAAAYNVKTRQVTVLRLLPHLIAGLPDDALFQIAVTDRDLWLGKGGRAFGWSSFRHRVGIMSTRRLGAEPERRRRRLVSLALHEASHLLSIPHCLFYRCLMNGARTMREADRRPTLLCPVCRAKLCWNLSLRPEARYLALETAFRRIQLPQPAADCQRAARVTRLHKKS